MATKNSSNDTKSNLANYGAGGSLGFLLSDLLVNKSHRKRIRDHLKNISSKNELQKEWPKSTQAYFASKRNLTKYNKQSTIKKLLNHSEKTRAEKTLSNISSKDINKIKELVNKDVRISNTYKRLHPSQYNNLKQVIRRNRIKYGIPSAIGGIGLAYLSNRLSNKSTNKDKSVTKKKRDIKTASVFSNKFSNLRDSKAAKVLPLLLAAGAGAGTTAHYLNKKHRRQEQELANAIASYYTQNYGPME